MLEHAPDVKMRSNSAKLVRQRISLVRNDMNGYDDDMHMNIALNRYAHLLPPNSQNRGYNESS